MNRTPTNYVITREQKRYIAKQKMKEAGMRQFCKHGHDNLVFFGKIIGQNRTDSVFAKRWKEFVED